MRAGPISERVVKPVAPRPRPTRREARAKMQKGEVSYKDVQCSAIANLHAPLYRPEIMQCGCALCCDYYFFNDNRCVVFVQDMITRENQPRYR